MPIQKYIERLRYLDSLIQTRATGTVKQLAKKLDVTEISVLKIIKEMKDMGCPIKYCRRRNCYYYTQEDKVVLTFFDKDDNDLKRYPGGGGKNYFINYFEKK